jgi:hypothetical protein
MLHATSLVKKEKRKILEKANKPEYAVMEPSQIVPVPADRDECIASKLTIILVLQETLCKLFWH